METWIQLTTSGIAVAMVPLIAVTLLRTGRILERVEMLRVAQEKMNGQVGDHESRLSFMEGRTEGEAD